MSKIQKKEDLLNNLDDFQSFISLQMDKLSSLINNIIELLCREPALDPDGFMLCSTFRQKKWFSRAFLTRDQLLWMKLKTIRRMYRMRADTISAYVDGMREYMNVE